MLLNPAKPEHLIPLRHLDKVPQSFLEFLWSFARPVNKGDSKGATRLRSTPFPTSVRV